MRCQCDTQNPDTANFCMSCGVALRGIVNEEITKLHNEISEIEERRIELETVNTELKNSLEQQQKQLLGKENEIKNLKAEKATEIKKTQSGLWIIVVFLVIAFLFFSITSIVLHIKNSSLEKKINHIETKVIPPLQTAHNFTPQDYKSVIDRCYFYDDNYNRTNRYILYGEKIKIIRIKDNFAYGIYTSTQGVTTSGWVRMGDLEGK